VRVLWLLSCCLWCEQLLLCCLLCELLYRLVCGVVIVYFVVRVAVTVLFVVGVALNVLFVVRVVIVLHSFVTLQHVLPAFGSNFLLSSQLGSVNDHTSHFFQGPLAFAAFLKGAGRKWRLSTRKTFNSRQLLFLQTFYCKTKHPTRY